MTSKKIGSLWKHKSKEGKSYLAGNVEVINGMPMKIVVFPNEKKTKPNQPDYNIVLSQPQEPKIDEPSSPKVQDLGEF